MTTHANRFDFDAATIEAQHEPFFIDFQGDDGPESIEIATPTSTQIMRIAQGQRSGDAELIMVGLCGDKWPDVEKLLSRSPFGTMLKLIEAIMDHFDLNDEVEMQGPGGGKRKAKTFDEVQRLQRLGWTTTGN